MVCRKKLAIMQTNITYSVVISANYTEILKAKYTYENGWHDDQRNIEIRDKETTVYILT
jgi:hypothetical protein